MWLRRSDDEVSSTARPCSGGARGAGKKTAGGIILPDTAQEKPMEGKIVAAGSGSKAEDGKVTPPDVKKGDRILFGKWSGTEVKVDGKSY